MKLTTVIRRAPKIVRNAVRDLRFGKPLGGTIKTKYAHLGAHDVGNADYDDLAVLFSQVEVNPADVLVDVGCGKGRSINWFLTRYPGNRIVGIELDPDICAATAKRLRKRENVAIVCGDATELLPADGTVFYLFNPFDESVMRRYAAAMVERGQPATIVYYNSKHLEPYRESPRFIVTEINRPDLSFRCALIQLS
jgi:SAM-dependent methyltransferase